MNTTGSKKRFRVALSFSRGKRDYVEKVAKAPFPNPVSVKPDDALWPKTLTERLGGSAPTALQATVRWRLAARRTAFFCSARTSGDAILR